ncbi:MAG: hypothetical protein WAK50_05195 [Nitrososphaeraceae archaeon]|jgi:hypothetical protein
MSNRKNGISYWKGKVIIPLEDWILLKDTDEALEYFPDDFDTLLSFISETELQNKDEDTKRWYSNYLELMNTIQYCRLSFTINKREDLLLACDIMKETSGPR